MKTCSERRISVNEYAMYKGEEFIDIGTFRYLSKKHGYAYGTLKSYASKRGLKNEKTGGIYLIKLERDE